MIYKLNPSDLTFLYEGCKRCFYMKVVHNIAQPSIPLPSIFIQIAALLKTHYDDKHTSELHPELPPGIVSHGEKFIKSDIIELPDHNTKCYISGRFDMAISFEDGTYGVMDFKTGKPNSESSKLYSNQLHAYAYALEHASSNELSLFPITKIGLIYFHPTSINQSSIETLAYEADVTWVEIEKNEARFLKFIEEVMELIESPEPPESSPHCQWCNYIKRFK